MCYFMPNLKSSKKALRVSRRRRVINLLRKKKIVEAQRNLRRAIRDGVENLQDYLSKAFSALDKAAKSNFIPKRRADRKKSRLAKLVQKKPVV